MSKKLKKRNLIKNNLSEITDYDQNDTTVFISPKKKLNLADLGLKLPPEDITKVISIRLPTALYNQIRAYSTNHDIPYQAYIKKLLSDGVKEDTE